MSKILCKSLKKDGSPCQGQGLEQFDGYCIAHAPADKTREWRSRGGTNSATAARLDKRMPERLKDMMDVLDDGMKQVLDGTLSPAAYTAICRGVKVRIDLYRLADEEMEHIRNEESQTAAAEIVGAHGDFDILDAAEAIAAQQDQYRIQSLVDQDLVVCEQKENKYQSAEYALTDKGRKAFGYRFSSTWTQKNLDELRDELKNYKYEEYDLDSVREDLENDRSAMEAALADLASNRDAEPPRDPLTGQNLKLPPSGVRTGLPDSYEPAVELSAETLQDFIRQLNEMCLTVEDLENDDSYDMKRQLLLAGLDPETPLPILTTSNQLG